MSSSAWKNGEEGNWATIPLSHLSKAADTHFQSWPDALFHCHHRCCWIMMGEKRKEQEEVSERSRREQKSESVSYKEKWGTRFPSFLILCFWTTGESTQRKARYEDQTSLFFSKQKIRVGQRKKRHINRIKFQMGKDETRQMAVPLNCARFSCGRNRRRLLDAPSQGRQ